MTSTGHVRSATARVEDSLHTAIKHFLGKIHTVEERKRAASDHGLPRLRRRVYPGSNFSNSPIGCEQYGGAGGDFTAPVPDHLPAHGRQSGPIGSEDPGTPPTQPTFYEMLKISDLLRMEVQESLGVDILNPPEWAQAVKKKIEEHKNSVAAGQRLSAKDYRETILEYLILWERILAYELPNLTATQVALRWSWNMENFGRVRIHSVSALEVVAQEIEALGYIYAEIPVWDYKDGVKRQLSEGGEYIHKDSEAGQAWAKQTNQAQKRLYRSNRQNRLAQNILASDYGIDWGRSISINEQELAYMCLGALKRQLGFYDSVGASSNPMVNPVVGGGGREIQMTFDHLVYEESKELDWWRERLQAPEGFN